MADPRVRWRKREGAKRSLKYITKVEASPKKFSGVGGVAVCKESAVVHMNQVRSITIDETFTVTVTMMNFDLPQEVKNRDGKS